ncbi:MAG: efflux RND transporter periplasmic adaptor subunit [Dysgonamonadaceae bacterium]|jgi:membrane fusion protein (multidrug efflux system)|nr:efflux RND transporter periplasmic adaptor subunit [Dysgonamonadaceae bacterium]
MKFIGITLGAIALMLVILSCGKKQNSSPDVAVQTYPTTVVKETDVTLQSTYPVTVKGQEDIEIRPRIDGFIDVICVDEGARVTKGQELFKINAPSAEQALTSAQAAVQSAQAQVGTAKLNADRIKPLADKGIVGKVQFETAVNSYQTALAGLAQAEATLKNAKATQSWTTVTSPVNGLVGSINYRMGSLVNSANILTTVANTGSVYAHFSLNEKELVSFLNNIQGKTQAEKIKNIPPVTLTLSDGTVYEQTGKVETITGSVNITTGSVNFRAEFLNKEGRLRSGASGKISIPRRIENAIVVPQKATFSLQDKVIIYVVAADTVTQKTIEVIPMNDGKEYVVTNGLTSGERIVTDGVATLGQGKKISFEN